MQFAPRGKVQPSACRHGNNPCPSPPRVARGDGVTRTNRYGSATPGRALARQAAPLKASSSVWPWGLRLGFGVEKQNDPAMSIVSGQPFEEVRKPRKTCTYRHARVQTTKRRHALFPHAAQLLKALHTRHAARNKLAVSQVKLLPIVAQVPSASRKGTRALSEQCTPQQSALLVLSPCGTHVRSARSITST